MRELVLTHPSFSSLKRLGRPGFPRLIAPDPLIRPSLLPPPPLPPVVYTNSKLTHKGVVGYKVFENCQRKLKDSSLRNLLSASDFGNENLNWLVNQYRNCQNDIERGQINNQAIKMLNQVQFDKYLQLTRQTRHLNAAQSRKVRIATEKLCYYSATRKFTSKKTGKYSMKVAFLTLTAPGDADPLAMCRAFNRFLDYLSRTANCVYVWKKELGSESEHLHFHIVINNFVPYYIINWKWKRSLLAEGVTFTVNSAGVDTNSHYRIELPRSKKEIAHYIAKYLSKAYDLPGEYGYISGHSSVLSRLKEVAVMQGEPAEEEIRTLLKSKKVIRHDYVTIVAVDLLELKDQCPLLGALFENQYLEFSNLITLPQRFNAV